MFWIDSRLRKDLYFTCKTREAGQHPLLNNVSEDYKELSRIQWDDPHANLLVTLY